MAVTEVEASLHKALRAARGTHRIVYDPLAPPMLIDHDDVYRYVASRDVRCQEGELLTLTGITSEPIWAFWREIMFSKNGDEHRRLRQIVQSAYTVPEVKEDRGEIRARALALIEAFADGAEVDLVGEFVEPIVAFGICNRAGYDVTDHARVMRWGRQATTVFVGLSPENQQETGDAFEDMFDHLDEVIARRQAHPQDKVIDRLIAAHNDGRMSYLELRAMLGNIVIGGYATTQHALIWLIWYLYHHRDVLIRIIAEPELIALAVNELLRIEPPVAATFRTAKQDLEAGGCPFKESETFMISFLSANRDERIFPEPDRFDIDRDNRRQLAFGAGPHRCLGASLARAIIEEAALALFTQRPQLEISGADSEWSPTDGFRELADLHIKL